MVGTRAQGMAGAFVAVADDSTATWWNPAGLASGSFFSVNIERSIRHDPAEPLDAGPASRNRSRGFSIAFPALGLSYYHVRLAERRRPSPTGTAVDDREEGGNAIGLRTLGVSEYGASAGQSIGNHLVLASTIKLVRASSASTSVPLAGTSDEGLFDQAEDLRRAGGTAADLDLGLMVVARHLKLGLAAKHLRAPKFEGRDGRFELERQVRAGLAATSGPLGQVDAVTAAIDADLTRTNTFDGEVRYVAAGVEVWTFRRSLAVRGGIRTDTLGESRRSVSAGGSLAARSGLYLDGAWTFGSDEAVSGWSLGLRVSY